MGVHFCHPVAIQDRCGNKDVCVWQCPWHWLLRVSRPLWGEQGVLGVEALGGQKLFIWEDPFIGHAKLLGHDPLRGQHPVLGHGPDGTAGPLPVVGLLRHFDDVDRERAPGCQVRKVSPPHVILISLFVSCGKRKGTVRNVRAMSHRLCALHSHGEASWGLSPAVGPGHGHPHQGAACQRGTSPACVVWPWAYGKPRQLQMHGDRCYCVMHHTFPHHDTTDSMRCWVQILVPHDLHKQQVMAKLSNITFAIQRKHREGELEQPSSPFGETHASFLASDVDVLWHP